MFESELRILNELQEKHILLPIVKVDLFFSTYLNFDVTEMLKRLDKPNKDLDPELVIRTIVLFNNITVTKTRLINLLTPYKDKYDHEIQQKLDTEFANSLILSLYSDLAELTSILDLLSSNPKQTILQETTSILSNATYNSTSQTKPITGNKTNTSQSKANVNQTNKGNQQNTNKK